MTEKHYWWPLELSAEIASALAQHKAELADCVVPFELDLATDADRMLVEFLAKPVRSLIERDSLPHLGHIFVGWGNAMVDGSPLLDRVASFVHLDKTGKPFIYQCHPEGDFHPWQTFAYTMMAGIDPNAKVGTLPFSLREIAENSTMIRTDAMEDLGHLLFSFSAMTLPPSIVFQFNGKALDLRQLMDQAIHAHHFGSFNVCRKFHLTEGLCAAAATYPELREYKSVAQKFLNGQLDVMLTISLLTKHIESVSSGVMQIEASPIPALRKALLIGTLLENHIYSAGHVIELAVLAMRMGYHLDKPYINAIHHLLNHLNGCILRSITHFSPAGAFLPLGHYRRALTLYMALHASEAAGTAAQESEPAVLTGYWANFDLTPNEITVQPAASIDQLYTRAVLQPDVRPFFQFVLDEFSQLNSTGMDLQGGFDHFRRLHPDGWPRQLHFEFLDYSDCIGVELHFENPDLLPLMDVVAAEVPTLRNMFDGVQVEGLRRTDRTEAKIRLYHPQTSGPVAISKSMNDFVAWMLPIVTAELNNPVHGVKRTRANLG